MTKQEAVPQKAANKPVSCFTNSLHTLDAGWGVETEQGLLPGHGLIGLKGMVPGARCSKHVTLDPCVAPDAYRMLHE